MSTSFSRDLLRGSIDFMVLSTLSDKPKYGYLIQQDIANASKEKVKLPPGTLYPLLHKLESDKLIRSRWENDTGRKRKWYEITAKGRKRLTSQVSQWQEYVECVSSIVSAIPAPKPA